MKKRKSQLAVVVPVVTVIVLFFLYVTMVYPSLEQNRTIRRFISEQVLENMQQQKVHTLTEIYKPASLPFWMLRKYVEVPYWDGRLSASTRSRIRWIRVTTGSR